MSTILSPQAEDLIRGALDRQQHKLARLAAHLSAKLMPGRKRARAAAISKGGHGRDSRGRRGTGGGGSADAAKTVVALADVMRLRGGYAVSEALALYFQVGGTGRTYVAAAFMARPACFGLPCLPVPGTCFSLGAWGPTELLTAP